MTPRALVLLGPTASGKTNLVLNLAKKLPLEVISLDSAMVYKGMDIGTSKPSKEELAACPHHLIDICDPKESFSAAQFREEAVRLVNEISSRDILPVICGGTMMYYKALTEGLSPLPKTDPDIRREVALIGEQKGWPYLHDTLKDIDPDSYIRLDANDKQRISRAVEVYRMTGKPISQIIRQGKKAACPFPYLEAVIMPHKDRKQLKEIIRRRFLAMLDQGLVLEVTALRQRGDLGFDMPAIRSVGYRQVWEYLDGLYGYDEMVQKAVIATARLAKHQMTWLRGGLKGERLELAMGDPDALNKLYDLALKLINDDFKSSCNKSAAF